LLFYCRQVTIAEVCLVSLGSTLDPIPDHHHCELMSATRRHLVQIPALGCTQSLYSAIAPALSEILDITTLVPTASRYDAMVKDVLDLAPRRFIIMGTSMGARLALETTLAAPKRILGLVMIGAGPGPVADQAAGLKRSERIRGGEFEQVVDEMSAMVAETTGPNGPATIAAFKAMAHETGIEIMASQSDALAHRTDLWKRLTAITCPTLFLWGREDKFSAYMDAVKMNGIIAGSRCAIIAGCGHFPTLEFPDHSSSIILQWLKDNKLAG
jgi:pimeloyl-ACP methyl ester carboxylesterase